jgi:hypothetical protein
LVHSQLNILPVLQLPQNKYLSPHINFIIGNPLRVSYN